MRGIRFQIRVAARDDASCAAKRQHQRALLTLLPSSISLSARTRTPPATPANPIRDDAENDWPMAKSNEKIDVRLAR